jgi:hypothetical protein
MLNNEVFQLIKSKISSNWKGKIIFIADKVKNNDYYSFIEYIKFYIDWRDSLAPEEARTWPEVTFSHRVGGYPDFFISFKVDILPTERVKFDPNKYSESFWKTNVKPIENAQAKKAIKPKKKKRNKATINYEIFN